MTQTRRHILLTIAVTALALAAAFGLRSWIYPPANLQRTELTPEPNANLQNITLSVEGVSISFDQFKGRWFLLYFGTTACPENCMQTLGELVRLDKKFDGTDQQYRPTPVFISIDPAHDNAAVMTAFTSEHFPGLNMFSGNSDELESLTDIFDLPFHHTTTEADMAWLAAHPSRIYIVDPQLRYIGSLPPDTSADAMYTDLQQLTHQLWRYHHNR